MDYVIEFVNTELTYWHLVVVEILGAADDMECDITHHFRAAIKVAESYILVMEVIQKLLS